MAITILHLYSAAPVEYFCNRALDCISAVLLCVASAEPAPWSGQQKPTVGALGTRLSSSVASHHQLDSFRCHFTAALPYCVSRWNQEREKNNKSSGLTSNPTVAMMDFLCAGKQASSNETLGQIGNGTEDVTDYLNSLSANCTAWMFERNRTGSNFEEDGIFSTIEPEENPSYFSRDYRIVGTFFQGLILLVGVLGNLLVVLVVFRTRSMHSPTNCYLVSLAAADCVVLIASVPNEILSYYVIGSQWIWGPIGCAIFVFLQNLGINASSLSLTAFTVERYIAICHPMKAQSVCTVKRAKKIVGGVWAFAFCYSSPWLGLTVTEPIRYRGFQTVERCAMKLSRQEYLGYFFADIIVFYLVPLLISCVLYGLIARVLFTGHFNKYPEVCRHDNQSSVDPTKSSRVQVVKMLVVVVVIFATLWLPYRGMLVYNSFATMYSRASFMDLWFLMFAKTCVYINSAINPILYTAMSIKFRRAFQRILLCGRSSINLQRSPGTQMRHLGHLA